ncbi:hypothetical protein H1C71_005037, partial [Ictidomys tridecemlineatus]
MRGKAERARREGGVVEVRAPPPSPVALLLTRSAEGRGGANRGRQLHTQSFLVEWGERRKGTAPLLLLVVAKEEESQGPYPQPQTQKRPPPPSPRKQPPAQTH